MHTTTPVFPGFFFKHQHVPACEWYRRVYLSWKFPRLIPSVNFPFPSIHVNIYLQIQNIHQRYILVDGMRVQSRSRALPLALRPARLTFATRETATSVRIIQTRFLLLASPTTNSFSLLFSYFIFTFFFFFSLPSCSRKTFVRCNNGSYIFALGGAQISIVTIQMNMKRQSRDQSETRRWAMRHLSLFYIVYADTSNLSMRWRFCIIVARAANFFLTNYGISLRLKLSNHDISPRVCN